MKFPRSDSNWKDIETLMLSNLNCNGFEIRVSGNPALVAFSSWIIGGRSSGTTSASIESEISKIMRGKSLTVPLKVKRSTLIAQNDLGLTFTLLGS
jgi:hypothetical protein